jgi:hypothetical protein
MVLIAPVRYPIAMARQGDWQNELKTALPVLVAIISTLFVAIRLLAVSAFDPETADGILQASGTAQVLTGTALSTAGPVALLVATLCYLVLTRTDVPDIKYTLRILVVCLVLFSAISTPLYLLVTLILLSVTMISGARVGGGRVNITRFNITAALIQLVLIAAISPLWLPLERLEIRSSKPVTAYVLSTTDQDVTILIPKPKKIRHIDTSDLVGRIPCRPRQSFRQSLSNFSLAMVIFGSQTAKYPSCPT